jgi:hypothetical protein
MFLDRDFRLITKLVEYLRETPCELDVVADDSLGTWNCSARIGTAKVNATTLHFYCGESTWILAGTVTNPNRESEDFGMRHELDEGGVPSYAVLEGGEDSAIALSAPIDVVAIVLLQQLALTTAMQLEEVEGEICHLFANWEYVDVWPDDDSLSPEEAFQRWTNRRPTADEVDAVIRGWEQCVRYIFLMSQGQLPARRSQMFSRFQFNAREVAEKVAFPQLAEGCPDLVSAAIGIDNWLAWNLNQYVTARAELDKTFFQREEF